MDIYKNKFAPTHKLNTTVAHLLPSSVCFRVTRFCNARCGFCLAPPDGGIHPSFEILKDRIDWLFANGVKTIHFCGGEPTIHHDLPKLIRYVTEQGKKSKLTTNGISISDELIHTLYASNTQVKVSLHGPCEHHNDVVGVDAFNKTVSSIQRLISSRVFTSIQTTIVSGHLDIVDWSIRFCLDNGVKRVSFLPFIPRGNGYQNRNKYELSSTERRNLRDEVKQKRRKLISRIDIRLLDFNSRPIHVIESDGRVVLESATEAMDVLLYRIHSASEVII
jgi:MoaA/NifB/PqqE/SkfB family radical SAM enzyme